MKITSAKLKKSELKNDFQKEVAELTDDLLSLFHKKNSGVILSALASSIANIFTSSPVKDLEKVREYFDGIKTVTLNALSEEGWK